MWKGELIEDDGDFPGVGTTGVTPEDDRSEVGHEVHVVLVGAGCVWALRIGGMRYHERLKEEFIPLKDSRRRY